MALEYFDINIISASQRQGRHSMTCDKAWLLVGTSVLENNNLSVQELPKCI